MLSNEDYYFNEQGLMVFTAAYHLKRGYCCGNNCLYCPYNHENVPESSNIMNTNSITKTPGNEEE